MNPPVSPMNRRPFPLPPRRFTYRLLPMPAALSGRPRLLLLSMMCGLLAGCGAATYKARLDETAEYFSYKQKLEEELAPSWSAWGVAMRTPKQFQMLPAPPPPPEDEEDPQPIEDPRQPKYLPIEFPGMLAAWEATVLAEQGGTDAEHKAYLYVLGNHSRYIQGPDNSGVSEAPENYLPEVEELITSTIGVVLPEGETGTGKEKNQRYREDVPRGMPNRKFAPKQDFIGVTLTPEIDPSDLPLPIEMQLYEWSGQRIQVVILMIYPRSISPQEHLQERLLLALETFSASDTPPSSSAQSGGGAPGGGGGGPPAGF